MKNRLAKSLACIMAATLALSLAACGSEKTTEETVVSTSTETTETSTSTPEPASDSEPVEISYATFMVGTHASAQAEAEVIAEFNKLYEGKIKVNVEELPSDDAFVDKMKTLASSKSLPDVLIGKNGIRELAVKNGQAVDLKPFLDADPDWMTYVGEGAMNYNMEADGSVYSISNQRQIYGYFYNKEMFDAVGITPAKTWDEWMENNEKLLQGGYTPLALMTGENAWTTNLWLAAYIGSQGDEGNKYMNTPYPESYNTEPVINGLTMMQECLQKYTTADAVGAIYANAANAFEQGQTAMIANGLWMTPDFSDTTKSIEGFKDKVGVALYPENGIFSQYEVGYILCTNGKSEEEQAAALEFLKFKTGKYAQSVFLEKAGVLPLTDNVDITDEYKAENPALVETLMLAGTSKYAFGTIDNNAHETVVDEFAVRYPELVYNEITPEEFATYLTEAGNASK